MSKEFHPLVSIVIPVYNGANYIREAIDSVLAQTYPNIEILVINDGSADDGATHDIAMSYGDKIRYFNKQNGGVVSALNLGIENMHGEYFAWLSHDDLYLPEKIEKQVLALKNHKGPKPAFCVCNCTFINDKGQEMYKSYVSQDCAFDNPRCFLFLEFNGFNGIMVLIPKKLFDVCGSFTPSLATHEYDMWLRLMNIADVVVEPECLTFMRIHPNQVSNRRRQDAHLEIDNFMRNGVRDIPPSEFEDFIAHQINKKGIKYILDIINSFMWYQNLPLTALQIMERLRLMCKKSYIQNDLYSNLLGEEYTEKVKTFIAKRLCSDKPLIIIHSENLTNDVFTGISSVIALLSTQYEIVIFYRTIDTEPLQLLSDVNIIAISLMNHFDYIMPECLGLLSYLLTAKAFWYYSYDNQMQYSKVFHYLDLMSICSIASAQDINKVFINTYDNNANDIDQKKHLSKTSLITSNMPPFTPGLFGFQNIITISDNALKAFVRWKMIFDVLLATNEFLEVKSRINNCLSSILEKKNISFSDYLNNYIRDFLVEVDRKARLQTNLYEQRRFWKLTNPLRSFVGFSKKSKKAIKLILRRKKSFRQIIYHLRMVIKNRRIPV